MIVAVDVDYRESIASVAGVCFHCWTDEIPKNIFLSQVPQVADYEPGEFYKREMPCILQLLTDHNLEPDIIVIDGFVVLGKEEKPGLGMHLYNALNGIIPIIGVAKTSFKDSQADSEVLRGQSQKPLYVTTAGIDQETARNYIQSMHGEFRIPTLLKLVDRECRQG